MHHRGGSRAIKRSPRYSSRSSARASARALSRVRGRCRKLDALLVESATQSALAAAWLRQLPWSPARLDLGGPPAGLFLDPRCDPADQRSAGGVLPGLFEETLPTYELPEHDVLVAVLDADLYTSTATALSFLESRLSPGSYLYFDQLHHRCDELRALNEFLDEHPMTLQVVARTRELSSVAFQRIA